MTARHHHPSCAAASGGNCTNCPPRPLIPVGKPVHQSDITCDECGETYVVTGETSEARERALAAWPGCPCAPKTASEATAFEADAPEVPTAEWTIGRRVVPSAREGVGTGAGEVAPRQDTGSAWVTRSADCPEAPAQAHPLAAFLHRLRAWWATWPFAADEFTA